jgi:hypothetical protein
MVIAIHANPAQPHQRRYAEHLRQGFLKHGLSAEITPSQTQPADVHVVLGPHYAKREWIGHGRTVLLDRAYYRPDPEHVSLGWLREDGGRRFSAGSGRNPPAIEPDRSETGTIFLADYDGPVEKADTVRHHPANEPARENLRDALRRHRVAIGYQTSALVTAALMGLEIVCKDPRNILWEPDWLELLPYADWHWSEIESGDAWEHLNAAS